MNKLENITNSIVKPSFRFVKDIAVDKTEINNEIVYILTLVCDSKILNTYFEISKNFFNSLGKLKKDLVDRPLSSFTQLSDENNVSSTNRSKNLQSDVKKTFYLGRKMSGVEFPSGPVILRIVLQ